LELSRHRDHPGTSRLRRLAGGAFRVTVMPTYRDADMLNQRAEYPSRPVTRNPELTHVSLRASHPARVMTQAKASRTLIAAVGEDQGRGRWHAMADLTSQAKGAVEAFNNADWDEVTTYFGNSTYHEFGTQRSLSGIDAILEVMRGWKAAMPDVRGTVTGAVEQGQRVVLEIMWEGTQTGEMLSEQGTIPASGKRQKTPAAFVFDYEDGTLKESRHYFDMLTFLKQIGAA
jgi:steroid delta-isomerase-like uncharacterized protein